MGASAKSIPLVVLIAAPFVALATLTIEHCWPRSTVHSLVVRASEGKVYDIPGGICRLYPDSPTGRLSCAFIEQDGRYPEEGQRVNASCTEAVFLIQGSFDVELGDEHHTLNAGDVVYIAPGTPYAIKGSGTAFVFIEPRWDKGQNTQAESP